MAGIASVGEDDDIIMITDQGQIVRTRVSGIPVYSRSASGVIVMRLADGQSVVNFTKLAHEDEEQTAEEAEQTESGESTATVEE